MLSRLIVHVGLHKTGTTWLQKRAFTPDLGVQLLASSDRPWDDSVIRALVTGTDWDPQRIREEVVRRWDGTSLPVLSAERLGGHPISGGYDRWAVADRLAETFEGSRILVGSRTDGWLDSIYAQMLQEGYTGRSLEVPKVTSWKSASWPGIYCDVDAAIQGYRVRFGHDRVLELPYETLRDAPHRYANVLAEFSGHPAFEGLPKFAGLVDNPRPQDLDRLRLSNFFRRSALNPHPVLDLGARGSAWLARLLKPF